MAGIECYGIKVMHSLTLNVIAVGTARHEEETAVGAGKHKNIGAGIIAYPQRLLLQHQNIAALIIV